jgi:hypothetical protein
MDAMQIQGRKLEADQEALQAEMAALFCPTKAQRQNAWFIPDAVANMGLERLGPDQQ